MPAQLISLDQGLRILLDKPILLLGRDAECDIQFESRKISRRHCCIAQVGERWIVRDLGSTNGVRINGVRVLEGYLKEGDQLGVGSQRYRMALGGPELAPPRHPPSRARRVSDEVLEAADDPVLLSDSDAKPPSQPKREKKRSSHPLPRSKERDEKTRGAALPDHFDLKPESDIIRTPPPL
jgi:pSer/pThr/pTyr-binding forkhead associated (FHA) protein